MKNPYKNTKISVNVLDGAIVLLLTALGVVIASCF